MNYELVELTHPTILAGEISLFLGETSLMKPPFRTCQRRERWAWGVVHGCNNYSINGFIGF
jgi:hypothetical protein